MRGEHTSGLSCTIAAPGSSPHARGALCAPQCFKLVEGIIPACAGSTYQGRNACKLRWDHPRMRGEH